MTMRAALLAFTLGTAVPAAVPLAAQPADTVLPAPPGRLVDVGGGRRLHILCSGTGIAGAPTIVLEAGASSFAIDWTLVQRELARAMRVCAYDRAGSGWSDPTTIPVDAGVARDLHALLQGAGERAPYVLVGASAGGLYVRHYTAEYPAEVAGLVFVDPATETRLFTLHRGETVLIAALDAEQLRETIPARDVAVPKRAVQRGAPFDRLPAEQYAVRLVLDARLVASVPDTVPYAIVLESAESARAGLARLRAARARAPHPLGDRPIVVLTRGIDASPGVREAHAYVAGLSTNARHSVVAGAGHEIHLFAPGAVVQAVEDVVSAVRGGTRLPPR